VELANVTLHFGGSLSGVAPKPYGYVRAARSQDDAASGDGGGGSGIGGSRRGGPSGPDPGSFSTMLSALLTARTAAQAAVTLYELAGAEWWDARGETPPPAPPEGVMLGVLRDLFAARGRATAAAAATAGGGGGGGFTLAASAAAATASYDTESWSQHQQVFQHCDALPRAAARDSLLSRLALHCMTFGNARAIALLWHRFVDEVRLRFWEDRALLPRMPSGHGAGAGSYQEAAGGFGGSCPSEGPMGHLRRHPRQREGQGDRDAVARRHAAVGGPPAPDHAACLIHQKLQMLNVCIFRRSVRPQHPPRDRRGSGGFAGGGGAEGSGSFTGTAWGQQPQRRRLVEEGEDQAEGGSGEAASETAVGTQQRGRLVASQPSSGALSAGANSDFYSVAGNGDDDDEEEEEDEAEESGEDPDSLARQRRQQQAQRRQQAQERKQQRLGAARKQAGDDDEEEDEEEDEEDFQDALEESGEARNVTFADSSASPAASLGTGALAHPAAAEDGDGEEPPPQFADPSSSRAADRDLESDAWASPLGVLEVSPRLRLLRHPDRPLRVPITQEPPFFTEDQHFELQAALAAAHVQSGGGAGGDGGALLDKMRFHQVG